MSLRSKVSSLLTPHRKAQLGRFVRIIVLAVGAQYVTGQPITAAVVVAAAEVAFRQVFPA